MSAGCDSAYARIASDPAMGAALGLNAWERIGLARTLDADGQEHRQDNNFLDPPDFVPMGPPARGSLEYPSDRSVRPPMRPKIALSERHWQATTKRTTVNKADGAGTPALQRAPLPMKTTSAVCIRIDRSNRKPLFLM